MKITKEVLQKMFSLAKLTLDEKKEDKMISDMQEILNFVSILNEIDGEEEEMPQGNRLENVFRDDEVKLCEIESQLLACTPHTIKNQSIQIPNIVSK